MLQNFVHTLAFLLKAHNDHKSNVYVRTNYIQPLMRLFPFLEFAFPAYLHDIAPDFCSQFAQLEKTGCEVKRSATPIGELDLKSFPIRYLIVRFLKLPSHLESKLFLFKLKSYWRYVGSWEAVVELGS